VECGTNPYTCGEHQDVRFCESVVESVEGADCSSAGLVTGKPFCFVASGRCVSTTYALRDEDCVVVRYEPVREWYDCSPGVPIFAP
jgi:hypothetical protein